MTSVLDKYQHRHARIHNLTYLFAISYIDSYNECFTTPQHKNKSAIGCQTNVIYIKR